MLSMFPCQFVGGVGGGVGKLTTKDVVTSSQKTAPGLIKYLGTYPLKMDGSVVGFKDIMDAKKHNTQTWSRMFYFVMICYDKMTDAFIDI